MNTAGKRFGLATSFEKTKTMVFKDKILASKKSIAEVDGEKLENVSKFCYFGHMVSNQSNTSHTDFRVSCPTKKFNELKCVLCDPEVKGKHQKKILEA